VENQWYKDPDTKLKVKKDPYMMTQQPPKFLA